MRSARLGPIASAFLLCLAVASPAASGASARIDRIREAVARSLCYDIYWAGAWGHGENYQRNVPLPLTLVVGEEKFYARIDPIGFVGKDRQPVRVTRIGLDRGRRAVVIANHERDVDLRFSTGPLIEGTLTIPADCTPRYDPPTPEKARKLQTVVSTMQKQLSSLVRMGAARYPPEITLIVADFNIDYPSTYVLVEPAGDLYTLTLHNPEDYDSNLYEREGEYPLRWVRVAPHLRDLLGKIRRHGIIQKILLTP